jgi:hypothetical protein
MHLSLRQRSIPDQLQVRVNALLRSLGTVLAPLDALLGGVVAQASSVRQLYIGLCLSWRSGLYWSSVPRPIRSCLNKLLGAGLYSPGKPVPNDRRAYGWRAVAGFVALPAFCCERDCKNATSASSSSGVSVLP